MSSASSVDLDITPRRLSLREEASGFELDVDLPHAVDEAGGSAKFDRSRQALTVVLPVLPSQAPPPVFTPATEGQEAEEAAAEQAEAEAAEAQGRARVEEAEAERRARERGAREERARVGAEAKEAARHAAVAQAEREVAARAQAMARGAPPARATESALRALQAAGAPPSPSPSVTHTGDGAASAEGEPAVAVAGIEPSAAFDGAREGKVFRAGAAGLGYYTDGQAQVPAAAPPRGDRLVVPADKEGAGRDGETSPEWVMVPNDTHLKMDLQVETSDAHLKMDPQDEEVNGAPPAAARATMPALKNGLLFELD